MIFGLDEESFFNEVLKLLERNEGNEIHDSG
jgi:hypothetical protein